MIRKPLLKLATFTIGTTSGTQVTVLPVADFDSLVVKAYGTLTGTSPTQDIYVQTSDDGGTTYYDCLHLAQVTATITNANALFAMIPTGSGQAKYVGAPGAANIAAGTISGLPLLDRVVQIQNTAGGTIGTSAITVILYAASQSGGF